MRVKFLQSLTIAGHDYAAGEVADLPPQTALQCFQRGTAEPVGDDALRLQLPPRNRVRYPGKNRRK
jgi:hypothetical protein